MGEKGAVPVGGVMCWWWMLAVVLACTRTLVRLVEVGPIYAAVGTCPGFCLGGVLSVDKHSFLDGPGLAVNLLVNNVKLVGVHGVSCGGAVEMYRGGGLEVFLTLSPRDLPDSPM